MGAKLLKHLPVEGVVVLQGQMVEKLQKGIREVQVRLFHLKGGSCQNLVDTEEFGVLQDSWGEGQSLSPVSDSSLSIMGESKMIHLRKETKSLKY